MLKRSKLLLTHEKAFPTKTDRITIANFILNETIHFDLLLSVLIRFLSNFDRGKRLRIVMEL